MRVSDHVPGYKGKTVGVARQKKGIESHCADLMLFYQDPTIIHRVNDSFKKNRPSKAVNIGESDTISEAVVASIVCNPVKKDT